jgi:microcin C transport system ATP-binding protein
VFLGQDMQGLRSGGGDARAAARHAGGVPGPLRQPVAPHDGREIIAEGLGVHGVEPGRDRREMVAEIMREVGLDPATMAATRTNSRAASASASPSPAR